MKLAVLELSRFDDEALRPWSADRDCVTLAINPPRECNWPRPPLAMTKYDTVAERHFAIYEPLFEAGSQDLGPRLRGAEIGFMAAADFAIFIETRYYLVLLLDLARICREHVIDRIEFVTNLADGGRYHEAVRAFADWQRIPYRHVGVAAPPRGTVRSLEHGLESAAGRVSVHGPAFIDYLRTLVRRRLSDVRPSNVRPASRDSARGSSAVRAAMLVYQPKSWRYLLPIRESLLSAGHDALLVSPRLASDEVLSQAAVDYVSIRRHLPRVKLRRRVADYLHEFDWPVVDAEIAPMFAVGGPLRALVVTRGLLACDIYADLAVSLPALFRWHRTNVAMGTDGGSVAGRCHFRTAERMGIEPVFVQHGSVFSPIAVRQYMLRTHRLLWGSTSSQRLAEGGVERPERNIVLGSPFHEERFGLNGLRSHAARSAPRPIVLVAFGVPGNYVTEGSFQRAACEVFDAAAKLPAVQFVIKPHPGDPGRVWRGLLADSQLSNVEIETQRDTYDLVAECTVLATMYSTTGSEAICMGKPVVSVDLDHSLEACKFYSQMFYDPT